MLIVYSSHHFPSERRAKEFFLPCLPSSKGRYLERSHYREHRPTTQVINGVLYLTTTTISLEAPATPTSQSSMLPQVGSIGNLLQRGVPNDGSLLWRQTTQQGMSDNAYVTNGAIYIASFINNCSINDGSAAVYAFRASDGSLLWHHSMYWVVYNPPVLIGSTIYVSTAGGEVYAFQASNGSLLWHFHTNVQ